MDKKLSFSHGANARALLKEPNLRKRCFECAAAGKRYSVDLLKVARKADVIEAVDIAIERLKRRSAAVVRHNDLEARLSAFKYEKRRLLDIAHADDLELFSDTVRGAFRTARAGSHFTTIGIEPLVRQIGAEGSSSRGQPYSSRCSYRRTDSHHSYRIPPHWSEAVAARGIALLDGLVTLWAEVESEQDTTVTYAAVWVGQGRGFSLQVGRGWIACGNGLSYHSTKSAASARFGLRRKLSWQSVPAEVKAARVSAAAAAKAKKRQDQLARLTERLERLDLADIGHIEVTYEDSRKVGNCHDGTIAFGERLFGDGRRRSTIGEIAGILSARGEQLTRFVGTEIGRQFMAACLHAIRRHRQTKRYENGYCP